MKCPLGAPQAAAITYFWAGRVGGKSRWLRTVRAGLNSNRLLVGPSSAR